MANRFEELKKLLAQGIVEVEALMLRTKELPPEKALSDEELESLMAVMWGCLRMIDLPSGNKADVVQNTVSNVMLMFTANMSIREANEQAKRNKPGSRDTGTDKKESGPCKN